MGEKISYTDALLLILQRIEESVKHVADPVKMYIAGGAALNWHTQARVTDDVDASFSKRILLPDDLEVIYYDEENNPRSLYFDRQYNDSFALLHENFDVDSVPYAERNVEGRKLLVYFLNPVDLAVSKLSRYSDQDISDIKSLAECGLISESELRLRAEEAIGGYVGNVDSIKSTVNHACRLVGEIEKRNAGRPKPK